MLPQLDEVALTILRLRQGVLMAKWDIANAYQVVPVHPDDRYIGHVLGRRSVL